MNMKNPVATHGASNGKWISKSDDGSYSGVPIELEYLIGVSLPASSESYQRYADNMLVCDIPSDQGYSGNLVLAAANDSWEKELGMKSEALATGNMADIKLYSSKTGALYYEFSNELKNKRGYTVKCWILGVTVGRPEVSTSSDTNSISPNDWSYPITVRGETAVGPDGTEFFRDENGFPVVVRRVIAVPGDANYKTFGDAVPEIKIGATTP